MTLELINPTLVGGGAAAMIFAGVIFFLIVGRRVGQKAFERQGGGQANVGSLEAAVFALLGLLIAFTFSGALQRFDTRRVQVVEEANTVGTAWMRLDLLPAAAQPKVREAFKAYVDSRIETYRKLPDIAAARTELAHSRELQDELWTRAIAATRARDAGIQAQLLVVPALNEMFNYNTTRTAASQIHPPAIIYYMLVALAFAAALLAGYQTAGERGFDWIHKIAFAGIVALTVYVILDIEYPRLGFVRIDAIDRVLVDVRAGMK